MITRVIILFECCGGASLMIFGSVTPWADGGLGLMMVGALNAAVGIWMCVESGPRPAATVRLNHAGIGLAVCITSMVLFLVHAVNQFHIHVRGWPETRTDLVWAGPIANTIISLWSLETRILWSLFWTYWSWEYLVIVTLFIVGWNLMLSTTRKNNDPVSS